MKTNGDGIKQSRQHTRQVCQTQGLPYQSTGYFRTPSYAATSYTRADAVPLLWQGLFCVGVLTQGSNVCCDVLAAVLKVVDAFALVALCNTLSQKLQVLHSNPNL